MNLKSDQEWSDQYFAPGGPNSERTVKQFIRQIQADALRWAAAKCQRISSAHSKPSIKEGARQCSEAIQEQANQLDPKLPSDFLPEPAVKKPTPNWQCPRCHSKFFEPEELGNPYSCPECGITLLATNIINTDTRSGGPVCE